MTYRFGGLELNEISRELSRDGVRVPIEPKVFDLICLLVRHRRRVLHRKLLLREIWPGVVVSEASLSRLVKEARRALGDNGEQQAMIRTVRGTGYRFVAVLDAEPNHRDRDEAERMISHARLTLDAAIERDARDLSRHVDEFVQTCQVALAAAHEVYENTQTRASVRASY